MHGSAGRSGDVFVEGEDFGSDVDVYHVPGTQVEVLTCSISRSSHSRLPATGRNTRPDNESFPSLAGDGAVAVVRKVNSNRALSQHSTRCCNLTSIKAVKCFALSHSAVSMNRTFACEI